MSKIQNEILSSVLTIVLTILAVFIFIYTGASTFFYFIVVIALVVGFYNAWLISKTSSPKHVSRTASRKAGRRRRK